MLIFAFGGLPAVTLADIPPGSKVDFSSEEQALVQATAAFFDAVEARDTPRKRFPGIAMPRIATKSHASEAEDGQAGVLTRMGPVDHLTGYRITWYPMDRLYGAVDFMGTWAGNKNLVCGYLTWDLSDPATPVLDRLSANFVDVAAVLPQGDTHVHQSLLEANCAHGALEDNYRFFDPSG